MRLKVLESRLPGCETTTTNIIKMSTNGAAKIQQAVTVSLDELRDGKFHL